VRREYQVSIKSGSEDRDPEVRNVIVRGDCDAGAQRAGDGSSSLKLTAEKFDSIVKSFTL